MTWAILSMISARFPPVSRWMRIAVTKNRASRLSTRRVIPVRASRKGTPRFCSSKTCRNSSPIGCGISWATSWMAPVKEWPARRERANISSASGNCDVKAFMRRPLFTLTTVPGTVARRAPRRIARTKGQWRNSRMSVPRAKSARERRAKTPTFISMPACRSRASTRWANFRRESARWRSGTSLSSSSFSTSGMSAVSIPRSSSRASRRFSSRELSFAGARRKYPPTVATRTAANTRSATAIIGILPSFFPVREHVGAEMDPRGVDGVEELRPNPGRPVLSQHLPVPIDAALLEDENVLHHDHVSLHPRDLAYGDDLAGPVAHPGQLEDDVQRGGDLLPDRLRRQIETRHQDPRLDPGEGVPGGVGVDCGDGS